MKVFKNYQNEDCFLTFNQEQHIQYGHPEATTELIAQCLLSPIEIRKSISQSSSNLYNILKTKNRYFCVVLKCCSDGNFISTAYATSYLKNGELIYKQGA